MQYRRLGSSGLQLSALSFGAWVTFGAQVGRAAARQLLALAHERGVNFFDNAETYNNGEAERLMGDVLADLRLPRDSFCVSSKVMFGAVENPLPTPSRPGHTDRGNRGGDGHAGATGQGALLGHQRVVG
jgi:aryl-alcohol dehydrogenase-like predicted oxidoreductase